MNPIRIAFTSVMFGLLAALLAPAVAGASGVESFESRMAGTVLTPSLPGEIRFDTLPVIFDAGVGHTSSGSHAAGPLGACPVSVSCGFQQMRFTSPVSRVSMRVGSSRVSTHELGVPVQLVAFTSSGERRFSDVEVLPGGRRVDVEVPVSVRSAQADIVRVALYSGNLATGGGIGVPWPAEFDDVSWSTDDGTPPQSAPPTVAIIDPTPTELIATAEGVRVRGTVTAPAGIGEFCVRANPTSRPRPCDQAHRVVDGRFSILLPSSELRLGRNSASAWVLDRAGRPHATSVDFRIADASDGVDVAVEAMELVQAIGAPALPRSRRDGSDLTTLPAVGGRGHVFGTAFPAVQITGKRTFIRVYGGVRSVAGRSIESVPAVPARLRAYRYDDGGDRYVELAGGPVLPMRMPTSLRQLDNTTNLNRTQRGTGDGYWFEVPARWTAANPPGGARNDIVFFAELNPSDMAPRIAECDSAMCRDNSRAALTGVRFAAPHGIEIRPIDVAFSDVTNPALTYGRGPSDPSAAFDLARSLLPVSPASLRVRSYVMSIDAGWMIDCTADRMAANGCSGDATADLQNTITRYTQDRESSAGVRWFGLYGTGIRGQARVWLDDSLGWTYLGPQAHAAADRPVMSLSHELHHILGANHASFCGGGGLAANGMAEPWFASPRNDRFGSILGIGVDLRDGTSPDPGRTPFKVFSDDRDRRSGMPVDRGATDHMSYCASENDSWNSTYNWARIAYRNTFPRRVWNNMSGSGDGYDWNDESIPGAPMLQQPTNGASTPGEAPGDSTTGVATTGGAVPALVVTASAELGGTGGVLDPLRAAETPVSAAPEVGDEFVLKAYDAVDDPLGSFALGVASGQSDHTAGATSEGALLMHGVVPAAAAKVELVHSSGAVRDTIQRSANAPVVDIVAPVAGAKVGGALDVEWAVSDADANDKPLVDIELSTDGGATFQPLAVRLPGTSTKVPATMLPRSGSAILRAVASDGFNHHVDEVDAIDLAGHAPVVNIASPLSVKGPVPMTTASDTTAYGWGYHDGGGRLAFDQLVWTLNGKQIATGEQAPLRDLPPGRHTLRLTGTDKLGRSRSDAVTLAVVQRPLGLAIADADPGPNGVVRFSVESTEPMKAFVGGKAITLGLEQRTFAVDVGRVTPKRIRLVLRSGTARRVIVLPVAHEQRR